jgi:hypothetical protein
MTTNNINIIGGFSDRGVTSPLLKLHPPSIPKVLYKHMVLALQNHNGVVVDLIE